MTFRGLLFSFLVVGLAGSALFRFEAAAERRRFVSDEAFQTASDLIVTSSADTGTGTLRAALVLAEEAGGNRRIVFRLEKTDPNYNAATGTWTIKAKTPLVVTKNIVTIDGTTQASFGGNSNPKGPEVAIDGTEIAAKLIKIGNESVFVDSVIFIYGADRTTIRGLNVFAPHVQDIVGTITVTRPQGSTDPVTGTRLIDNYLGLLADGETVPSGDWGGVRLFPGAQDSVIENNVFCTPGADLLLIGPTDTAPANAVARNVARKNKFGTNAAGTKRIAPVAPRTSNDGIPDPSITIFNGARENIVEGNIIAGTRSGGVGPLDRFESECPFLTEIRDNRIGVGPGGENIAPNPAHDQSQNAVGVFAVAGDTVSGNIIGNFGLSGIYVRNQRNQPEPPPTEIVSNQIETTRIGIQVGQIKSVNVSRNTIRRCTAGGIVLANKLLSAADIFSTIFITNPFGFGTTGVIVSRNSFEDTAGPGIAFTDSPSDIFNGLYFPNLATVPGTGPNFLRPSPKLEKAAYQADKSIVVTGKVVGAGILEVYSSDRAARPTASEFDVAAYGLGAFLRDFELKNGEFSITVPADLTENVRNVTTTFTVNGETSEFSRTVEVVGAPPPPDTLPPTVTVSAPLSGSSFESKAGAAVNVAWATTDDRSVVGHAIIFSGFRQGRQFSQRIAQGLPGTANAFRYDLLAGDEVQNGQMTVEARDGAGNVGQGKSGVFQVTPPPPAETVKPTVTIISPTAGTIFESRKGVQVPVVWTSSDNVGIESHSVLLLRSGKPETLASGLAGTAQNYIWTIPEGETVPEAQVTVEARDAAGNVGTATSGTFAIQPPKPPDTERPNVGGITLSKKKINRKKDPTITISWFSQDNVGVVRHDVSYATDGLNFNVPVASGLAGGIRQFTWTVPETLPKTRTAAFKVEARDEAGNTGFGVGGGPLVVK